VSDCEFLEYSFRIKKTLKKTFFNSVVIGGCNVVIIGHESSIFFSFHRKCLLHKPKDLNQRTFDA
jgi:hypothetical protein